MDILPRRGARVVTTKDKGRIAHDIRGTNNKNVEIEMISNSCYELQLLMVLAHTRYIIVIGPIGNTTDRMVI
jgi:hypothetical protein